jgi:Methionine biosynthesis protein MetW
MSKSLIYRNIFFYRILMNILYLGRYKYRFDKIIKIIRPDSTSVVELCFGDTCIAQYCVKNQIQWTGFDLNENFVSNAIKQNLNAVKKDILSIDQFPSCDTYIMIGSLYHFREQSIEILKKMVSSANQVIISEPIKNLSNMNGLVGFIAKKSANAGKGEEHFRYNQRTFLDLIDQLGVKYRIVSVDKDILIEINND